MEKKLLEIWSLLAELGIEVIANVGTMQATEDDETEEGATIDFSAGVPENLDSALAGIGTVLGYLVGLLGQTPAGPSVRVITDQYIFSLTAILASSLAEEEAAQKTDTSKLN